jgi:adenylyltransferase/sulfurtransferase
MLVDQIGEAGQQRLAQATVAIVGVGALGCATADALARGGVGRLILIDRDIVERTNLQRQSLFDERQALEGLPKAIAAAERLSAINSDITVEPHVTDFSAMTAALIDDADLIIDGLDNFETRYLLNDCAVSRGMPYLYGGAVGTSGTTMTILPHVGKSASPPRRITWTTAQATPCLRCLFPEPPPPGSTPTCDTVGVLATIIQMTAARQVTDAIKVLIGAIDELTPALTTIDAWSGDVRAMEIASARRDGCPCCGDRQFDWLTGDRSSAAVTLCGRDAVQVSPPSGDVPAGTLLEIAGKLDGQGLVSCTDRVLRATLSNELSDQGDPLELTLFADLRAIIKGTNQPSRARAVYARYVGN